MTDLIKTYGPGFSRNVLCYLYNDKCKVFPSTELVICLLLSVSVWNVYNRLLSIHGQTNNSTNYLVCVRYTFNEQKYYTYKVDDVKINVNN